MTQKIKHTPTPWKASGLSHYWDIIPENKKENDPFSIGNVCSSYPEDKDQGLQQANAEHIVKCVNMHDELVEALQGMVNANRNPRDKQGETAINKAIDILKKAKGEA